MTAGYLFDSHALLAFFQKEEGAETVAKILQESRGKRLDQLISVINLGEIIYMTKRQFGDPKKVEILGRIHQLGLKVLRAPESVVYKAAELKAEYPVSYADCFALAGALEHSAIIVTATLSSRK